jgi:ATP-dependent exoDNAse (exonuclease V) beta subunit
MQLTQAQIDAITRSGQDVCVIAGPGSGKTRVLIERFAWLVEERNIDPSRILAITFTEKAATEIKERLIRRFAERFERDPVLRESIERAWVSTIHGFCARLLRENAIAAGLSPDFTVLDQPAAESMAREAAENALDQMFSERPGDMRGLLESLDLSTDDYARKPDLAKSLLDVYESMRVAGLRELPVARVVDDIWPRARELASAILADGTARGKDVPLLREFASRLLALGDEVTLEHFEALSPVKWFHLGRIGNGTRAHAAAKELKEEVVRLLQQQWVAIWHAGSARLLREAISRIDALYREAKRREAAIDFAGLEEETIRLLESDTDLRQRTASRFDQILMDELQDTNALQWRLVGLIRRTLFAVGDINQSIYGFRHAEPAVFAKYRDSLMEAGARVDDLRENHRSLPEILGAVSRALDGQKGIEPRPLIASRSDGNFAPAVELLVGRGEEGNEIDQEKLDAEDVEASMVAARIREFCPDNRDSGGVALKDIAILVRALGATKPFERALDRFGVPFLVSGGRTFLEAREIRDVMALLAALVNPLDEIAVVGVLRSPLVGMSDEETFRMGRDGWRAEFERWFGKLRPMAGFVAPDLLLASALDECGYAAGLTDRARANVEKFLAHIRREHRRQPRPLADLLDSLEALRATQSEAEAAPPEAGNVVRVMTIHAAKGLEFPIVFVSALHRGIDQSKPAIAFSTRAGLGAKWRNPFTGAGQADRAHKKIVEEIKEREAAEENRLLYVAMTRAEDHLILSYAEKKRASGWPKLVNTAIGPPRIGDRVMPAPNTAAHAAHAAHGAILAGSVQWLDPPAIASRHDAAAAVTSIALFHACPRKYLLSSIGSGMQHWADRDLEKNAREDDCGGFEKRDNLTDDQGDAGIAFGSEVHRILAGEEGATDQVHTTELAVELASRFTGSELGQRAARATRVEREFDFLFYFEDVVLRGQIDLWFEEGGELIVVDYKTDRVSDDRESSEAYALQLQIYALSLERYAGRAADRAVLYYLRPDKMIDVPIDPGAARAAVLAFLNAQDAAGDPLNPDPMNSYPMKPGEQCRRCAFFGNLCVGTAAVEGTVDRATG